MTQREYEELLEPIAPGQISVWESTVPPLVVFLFIVLGVVIS